MHTSIKELNEADVLRVSAAGLPAIVGGVTAYLWILDQAYAFGQGLGAGLYDGIHGSN